MASTRIGILSDTHLPGFSELFEARAQACFSDTEMIFHAGDLTDPGILEAFKDKQVFAVHGNMCAQASKQELPAILKITIKGFEIILTHGNGYGYGYHDIEDRLFNEFTEADCIVYGHTHAPVCHLVGHILFINPGSFNLAGSRGTYAILEIDKEMRGTILQISEAA
jgi:putative phosphoesterase